MHWLIASSCLYLVMKCIEISKFPRKWKNSLFTKIDFITPQDFLNTIYSIHQNCFSWFFRFIFLNCYKTYQNTSVHAHVCLLQNTRKTIFLFNFVIFVVLNCICCYKLHLKMSTVTNFYFSFVNILKCWNEKKKAENVCKGYNSDPNQP